MTTLKHILLACTFFLFVSGLAHAENQAAGEGASGETMMNPNMPRVRLATNLGDIVIALDQAKAPKTVANFLAYVNEGFYNGTIFHRVIDGFMIQGGGYTKDFQRKATHRPIENEANNGLKNERGTIAMARTSQPHSATSQFFINVVRNDDLNFRSQTPRGWGYAVFGKVVEGMDVVDAIRRSPTGTNGLLPRELDPRNVPKNPIIIESATIDTGANDVSPTTPAAPGSAIIQ